MTKNIYKILIGIFLMAPTTIILVMYFNSIFNNENIISETIGRIVSFALSLFIIMLFIIGQETVKEEIL